MPKTKDGGFVLDDKVFQYEIGKPKKKVVKKTTAKKTSKKK